MVSWRRLIYFGEALAHSSLLGIALALYFDLPLSLGIWSITLVLVLLLFILKRRGREDGNNILGVLSHFALALGLVLIAAMENIRTDLMGYLFGDILATTSSDLWLILLSGAITIIVLRLLWQSLLLLTLNPDLGACELPRSDWIELVFLLILGGFVGVMVQYFGLLLVIAMLIIPANTANRFARTPEQSALFATLIAGAATTFGIAAAWQFDLPVAPAIVVSAGCLYFLARLMKGLANIKKSNKTNNAFD
ncbi:metal ABC transporter permease [Suttonella sp. R2A3]|uniref:metal ABC transporter permease n=1 Tax=Suttonella sp. R2A3 TaxID=2908648 RepID=UPI001F329139|nr:metal ABC transporter permease [Suttonella sp. R2A3]